MRGRGGGGRRGSEEAFAPGRRGQYAWEAMGALIILIAFLSLLSAAAHREGERLARAHEEVGAQGRAELKALALGARAVDGVAMGARRSGTGGPDADGDSEAGRAERILEGAWGPQPSAQEGVSKVWADPRGRRVAEAPAVAVPRGKEEREYE